MTGNPYSSPAFRGEPAGPKSSPLKPTLIGLFVVVGIVGLLIVLFLPAVRSSKEAARRTECKNKLKQIAFALIQYEAKFHALPPAYTVDAEGTPLHSWRTLILPYLEQQALYDQIDLSKPWNDPANQAAFDTPVPAYCCPSAICPRTHTAYLAIVTPGGCFLPTKPRNLSEITDDHNYTLVVIEGDAKRAVHWMSPTDTTEQEILNPRPDAMFPHHAVIQAVCVDGSVLALRVGSKPELVRALISIAGNDDAIAEGAN